MLIKFLIVAFTTPLGIITAVAAGLALLESPVMIFLAVLFGSLFLSALVLLISEQIVGFLYRNKTQEQTEKSFLYRIWHKLGIGWFIFLATIILGPLLTTAIAAFSKIKVSKIFFYLTLSIIFWDLFFLVPGIVGLGFFKVFLAIP